MARGMDSVQDRIRADIARCGQSIIYTADGHEGFCYTVGRTERGLPELLIAATLDPRNAMGLMNAIDLAMPERLPSGSLLDLGGDYPLIVLDAIDPRALDEFCIQAAAIYGDMVSVQQIVMCDLDGNYPPHCAFPYNRQPLLGGTRH